MRVLAYYNEIDPYAAEWLRNLIAAGLIAPGDVDTRSIVDVRPSDLDGYERCHFFAGIGVWDYALGLAGWPAGRPVWTGSCPCQPFSAAGRRTGFDDERHLWPAWFDLIRQCRPDTVLGEQVEAAVRLGWLDAVFGDLEGQDYACGAVVLGAHSVGAPHIRQRLWFVADATEPRRRNAEDAGADRGRTGALQSRGQGQSGLRQFERGGDPRALGHPDAAGRQRGPQRDQRPEARQQAPFRADPQRSGFWSSADWIPCRDGKARPVEPGTFPLAHGAPARVGRLRAYGNAINAEAAAAFIGAVIDTLSPTPGGLAEGGRS